MLASRSLALALSLGLVTACGSELPRSVVYGPYGGEDQTQLWARTLSAVSDAGYEPLEADPGRGRFLLRSRAIDGVRFEVQLFQEGWIRFSLAGPIAELFDASGDRVNVPMGLAQELQRLLLSMNEGLEVEPSSEDDS